MSSGNSPAPASLAADLVRQHFGVDDDELLIGGLKASGLAETYGTPLYVYDAGLLRSNFRTLSQAVRGFANVYYSVKANPNPAIARLFVGEGAGLEVASGAEFLCALHAGCAPERILFAGPGKNKDELRLVLEAGIGEVHVEGFDEIELIAQIAATLGKTVPIAIRINPIAAVQGGAMRMGGKPAAFGFDEEVMAEAVAAIRQHHSLELSGVHLFAGTQVLSADVLLTQWRHGLELASRLGQLLGKPLKTIDLGGGLGIPYHTGDMPLDLAAVRDGVPALIAQLKADPYTRDAHVILEPGRYLAGCAGVYLMRVNAVKLSRGQRFVIADGGMHHHLAASGNLGQVVKRDYPILPANRMTAIEMSPATIAGPLCTPLDTLGRQTALPDVVRGDLIAVLQSGAYGLTASPNGFLSHPTPAEVIVENGTHQAVRRRGTLLKPIGGLC